MKKKNHNVAYMYRYNRGFKKKKKKYWIAEQTDR